MKYILAFLLSISFLKAGPKNSGLALPQRPSSGWSIRSASFGAAWRSFGEIEYSGASRSQTLMLPSRVGESSLVLPVIGELGSFSDRNYEDGYVNQDRATATSGDTWFWGYDSSSQVQGETLLFTALGSRSDFSDSRSGGGLLSNSEYLKALSPQVDFVISTPIDSLGNFLVSFTFFEDDLNQRYSNFSANQLREDYQLDFVDRYDISEISPIPIAPYNGSINGPGSLLTNIPMARERVETLLASESADFRNEVNASFELNAFSIALGPVLNGQFTEELRWQFSVGLTANIFKWEATQRERLFVSIDGGAEETVQTWRESNSGTEFRIGVYGKGDISYHFSEDFFLKTYFQAEIADNLKASVGNSTYELNPAGFSFGLAVGKAF